MGKRKTFFGSFLSVFNPLSLDGLSLYLNRNTNVNSRIAQYLDGSTDALNMDTLVGDLASTTTGIWAGWVKPVDATPSGTEYLVAFGDTNAESRISLHIETSGALRLVLEITGTNNIIMTTDSAFFTLSGVGVHVGIVQDATSIKMYKNAVLVASTDIGTGTGAEWFNDVSGLDNARIGCINFNSVGDILFLNTDVDEWGFWDNDTAVTISSLYNGGDGKSYEDLTTAEKVGLAGYYRLDDYLDSSGNSNTLTAIGTPTDVVGMVNAPSLIGESVYSWLDQGPNAYDFIQATANEQPLVSDVSVNFDNSNDNLRKGVSNAYSADTSGIIFISGYYGNSANNDTILCSARESSTQYYLVIQIRAGGLLGINIKDGTTQNRVVSTNGITQGEYYSGYVKCDGATWTINLNGVSEVVAVQSGANVGKWFNWVTSRANLSLGAIIRTSVSASPAQINKVIYSNAALSAGDITATETFMAAPLDPAFNPLNITGLQLYLNVDNATPSSWLDQSTNAYDFTQGTASQQPVVNTKSVDFDGSNDIQSKIISAPYIADTVGYFFWCGYWDGIAARSMFYSADNATNNNSVIFWLNLSGQPNALFGANNLVSTETLINGFNYGYFKSDASKVYTSFNGAAETQMTGTNTGQWWASVANRDNLSIGGQLRLSPNYIAAEINKMIYSNAALSAGEITSINGFMSSPHT